MVTRIFGFQNDMTAYLVNLDVSPLPTENLDQSFPTKIPWESHATAKTSSRTR
jgi:hypothetical protein